MSEQMVIGITVDADWLSGWRRHNARLATFAALSIAGAIGLWLASPSPDGRDPFYIAVAIQFAAWSLVNVGFAWAGARGVRRLERLAVESNDAEAKRESLVRALRFSRWLNVFWLAIAAAFIAAGYRVWSPSLVGHGMGMLVQATVLAVLDLSFERGLRPSVTRGE